MTKEKPRCGGRWTESRFRSFIISALRSASIKWAPVGDVKKEARVGYGEYKCQNCKEVVAPTYKDESGKRRYNIYVDHIEPVVDPKVGFQSWDEFIERMFCEKDNLMLLCKKCHDEKSSEEREVAKQRRKKVDNNGTE